MSRVARPWATAALVGALSVAGVRPASGAQPEAGADPPTPSSEQPNAEAQRLYDEGRVKFDTADYPAAIVLWTEAYSKVPDNPDAARIKALLIYNIATARERVFEVGQDLQQLRQAKILLKGFEQTLPQLYGEDELDAERTRVRERIATIDAHIAEVEAANKPVEATGDEPTPVIGSDDSGNGGRGLVIGGAVSLSLGAALLGVMGAGLAIGAGANDISELPDDDVQGRRDQFARGRTGNTLAIVGGALGGALAVTGAVLLGLGLKQKRSVALGPGPGMVGIGLRASF